MSLSVVVGLGANVGDGLGTLRRAARELSLVARVDLTSHVYRTAPVGGPPQPEFLNAAALVSCDKSPSSFLDDLLEIEARLGRVRSERWGPRVIDLDILWIDGVAWKSARLHVPHRHLRERAFALVPLLEIVPDACDPRTGERYVAPPGDVRVTGDVL